jgi:hypothetical protein
MAADGDSGGAVVPVADAEPIGRREVHGCSSSLLRSREECARAIADVAFCAASARAKPAILLEIELELAAVLALQSA